MVLLLQDGWVMLVYILLMMCNYSSAGWMMFVDIVFLVGGDSSA